MYKPKKNNSSTCVAALIPPDIPTGRCCEKKNYIYMYLYVQVVLQIFHVQRN